MTDGADQGEPRDGAPITVDPFVNGDATNQPPSMNSISPIAEPVPATPAPVPLPTARKRKRPSRWDRPPEPHDWRWVVGHIGRALIVTGLLMFGFVAYQLWGTGIETARAQNELDSDFNSYFDELGITPATIPPATSTSLAPEVTSTVAGDPNDTTVPSTETTVAAETTAPPTTLPPVVQVYPEIDPGDVVFQIKIPTIDVDYKVVAGVGVKDLRKGPGHFPNTPLPGQLGNAALAGHRTSHLAPFYDLDQLRPGDEIQIYTKLGDAYAYIVTESFVVNPSDYHVITDSDPNTATLTLVTCTPIGSSSQRLIVRATLDVARSSQIGVGELYYGQDPATQATAVLPPEELLPGDDGITATAPATIDATSGVVPTLPAPEVAPSGSVVDATTPASTAESAEAAPATSVSGAGVTTENPFANATDAFSLGWFSDSAAWPHVAAWAVLLGLVWYAAWRLAKRYRRLYLAFLVGFIPTVVVLYFFYENVNRLLPPAV